MPIYIPEPFRQPLSSGASSLSQSQGAGINMPAPSFSGSPQEEQVFASGNGLSDVTDSVASLREEFKLWLSRHPGLTIDEAIHRYREEQKAKRRRQGPKLH